MKTLLEHRQRDRAVPEPAWTEPAPPWAPGMASTCKEPAQHRNAKFFLLKRSPLSIKEKKKEKNRGKGYSEMRVFLPPPWSQTQV